MIRLLATRLRDVLEAASRKFPPPTRFGFQLAAAPLTSGLDTWRWQRNISVQDGEEYDEDDDSHIVMAVPKRRVSRRRKRIKYFQQHLDPIEGFVTCKSCGKQHPHNIQLCPFCTSFNPFLRNKDVPASHVDRIKREVELRILDKILEKRDAKLVEAMKATADAKKLAKKESKVEQVIEKGPGKQ